MKPALMHCIVDGLYGSKPRIVAVTTAKAQRYWGRDLATDAPTNFRASDLFATFTGPDGEARARALVEPVQRLRAECNAAELRAYGEYRRLSFAARQAFRDGVKALVAAQREGEP